MQDIEVKECAKKKPMPDEEDNIFKALENVAEIEVDKGKYKGQVVGGIRNGFGIQIWDEGGRYEGMWTNNKAEGKGKYIHPGGDVYEGEWKDGKVK